MPTGTEEYYERRALEYDQVYAKPERQDDLAAATARVRRWLAGRHVLEVAAGTGWWTERCADVARSVHATDTNDATLEVARHRRTWPPHVRFETADAFALDAVAGRFDAALAGFLWSHLELGDLDRFLAGVVDRLEPGSVVVLLDNRYVEGSNHPISRTDARGNTYQRRRLTDGSEWEVRKNFPTAADVVARLERHGEAVVVDELRHYWLARFRTPHGC